MRVLAVCIVALLLIPIGQAHTAAPPPDHTKRLLHDCNDDWFGGDTGGLQDRDGYDLHALDVREAYTEALGQHFVFRLVLNGDGPSIITLSLKAAGAAKTYDFRMADGSWSGSFDQVKHIADIQDGERFALEGIVKHTTLGVQVGAKLTDYSVQGRNGNEPHDRMPGNDATIGSCADNFQRRDYTVTGPTQYVKVALDATEVSTRVGEEVTVGVQLQNDLNDMAQTVSLSVTGSGATIRIHDPDSDKYVLKADYDLAKEGSARDGKFIHVAIQGDETGSGTATLRVTTSRGGFEEHRIDFTIVGADEPVPPPSTPSAPTPSTPSDPAGEGAPGPTVALLLAALLWMARRR